MLRTETRLIAAAAATWALLGAAPAGACTITTTAVAFGTYNPQAAGADDGTGTIALACHPSVDSPNVAIGTGGSGTFSPRRMSNGVSTLDYNLYTTTARTVVWGNGTAGTSTVTLSGGSVSGGVRRFSRTVFGRIPALQNVTAGIYGDTVIVTVTF